MENNNTATGATTTTTTTEEPGKAGTQTGTGTATGTNTNPAEETVTMTKAEYDKAIQSAEDKLRTRYSARIKELEALVPKAKTEAERDFEQRLADLEKKERENEEKEKILKLKSDLQSHGLDAEIADYLKTDVDTGAFNAAVEKVVSARLTASGYKPTGHQTNQPITRAEYDKMSYDEKAELYRRDPEAWKRLKH